jgi:hypothetical protein
MTGALLTMGLMLAFTIGLLVFDRLGQRQERRRR